MPSRAAPKVITNAKLRAYGLGAGRALTPALCRLGDPFGPKRGRGRNPRSQRYSVPDDSRAAEHWRRA